ncbi:hypothetical protein Ahy_A05g021869 [Arachis hypogaea]|uniref:Uncharacterized protein n=1 Tax=Arachis hypogaea TaxID=3818 RepID=A0A445CYR5_ARAHY|nr:hypothetical protein Ahy_A05g021869 [Arachis hypogaea]
MALCNQNNSLCITTVYQPVRELLQQERKKDMEKKKKETEGQSSEDASENKEDNQITLRSLNMEDMRQAKSQGDSTVMSGLENAMDFWEVELIYIKPSFSNKPD